MSVYQVAASPAQRRADASDAKGCGAQVALALMEWLQTWSDNPDYQTVWLHNTLNHFANTLFVDIHDFDEMQNFACKLTGDYQMSICRAWYWASIKHVLL